MFFFLCKQYIIVIWDYNFSTNLKYYFLLIILLITLKKFFSILNYYQIWIHLTFAHDLLTNLAFYIMFDNIKL